MDLTARTAAHRTRTLFAATIVSVSLAAQAPQPAEPKPDPTAGLPTFLLPVPGGDVVMGMTVEQWLQCCREAVSPAKPEWADRDPGKLKVALAQTAPGLGQETRRVRGFLLGATPVTNRQYEAFVKHMTAQGQKVRPPYHWWRWGAKKDYDDKASEGVFEKLFKGAGNMAPIQYWQRYGVELPYGLVDDKGQKIDDHPVVFVSKVDAVRFAGWLGMRLPTEEEWTRAARGDSKGAWPWSANNEFGDHFTEKVLKLLELDRATNRKTRSVGSVPFLSGPFGHKDMTGQIWEYTATVGLTAICGQKAFDIERKQWLKDKFLASLEVSTPDWKDAGVVVKGASYLSWPNPIEFQIDSRVCLQTDDVLEGVGFRLAKDLRPGYDLLVSLVSSDYNIDLFQKDQAVDFETSVGTERYVLDEIGFPKEYHAASLAALNFLSADKTQSLPKLEERSQQSPLPVGTLACTEPMVSPKLGAGLYTVCYRKGGIPRDLRDAWSAGYKEVQKAIKQGKTDPAKTDDAAAKPDDKKKDDKKEDKGDWRTVLNRYGLTEKDLEPKEAKEVTVVRFNGYEVPVDQDLFLFHDNEGKFVGHCKAGALTAGNPGAGELAFGQEKLEKTAHAKIEFKVRTLLLKDQKKGVEYTLNLILEQGPPAAGETWRVPTVK